MPEDWEIVPHQILAELRDEVHVLKEKLSQPSTKLDMVTAMNDLKKAILDMHAVFQTALEQTGKPENDLAQRLTAVEKQNEKILQMLAKGSLSDRKDAARGFPRVPPPPMPPLDLMQSMPSMQPPSIPFPNIPRRMAPPPMRAPRAVLSMPNMP